MKITDYIKGPVRYYPGNHAIDTGHPHHPINIHYYDVAGEHNDEEHKFICDWVTAAINEKLERETNSKPTE